MSYTFTPPTYRKALARIEGSLYMNVNQGLSVVKISGVWTQTEVPTGDTLLAGTEGVDWFIGGHTYPNVSDAIAAELLAAGYTPTLNP